MRQAKINKLCCKDRCFYLKENTYTFCFEQSDDFNDKSLVGVFVTTKPDPNHKVITFF